MRHVDGRGWEVLEDGRTLQRRRFYYDRMVAQHEMLRLAGITHTPAPWEEYDDDEQLVPTGLPEWDPYLEAIDDYLEDQLWSSPPTTSETCSTTSTPGIYEMRRLRSSRPHTCPMIESCSSSTRACGISTPTWDEALTA